MSMFHSPRKPSHRLPLPRLSQSPGKKARTSASASPRHPARRHGRQPLPYASQAANEAETLEHDESRPLTSGALSVIGTDLRNTANMARTFNGPLMEWKIVQEMQDMEQQAKEDEKKESQMKLRQQHLDELNAQRDRRIAEKDEHHQLWKRWRVEIEADAQRYHEEEESKRQRQIEVRRQFDEERRKQLDIARKMKERQAKADMQEGEDMLRAAQEAGRKAQVQEDRRKQKEKSEALKMAEYAQQARAEKLKLRDEEQKRDIQMAKEQQELLDKQDAERVQFFKKLKDKQAQLLTAYEAGVGNELERKAKEDEERAQRYQQLLLEKERATQESRDRKIRELKKASHEAVEAQLQEHQRQKIQEKQEEQLFLQKLRSQADADAAKEKARQESKRLAREANALALKEQMRERTEAAPGKVVRDQMNDVERRLNVGKMEQMLEKRQEMQERSEFRQAVAAMKMSSQQELPPSKDTKKRTLI
eukprot:CAMPEP_0197664788 /NCGR_PEP_ID=MMETSP1338-20131121/58850_1 /TAXON_ID=43686 ORGANISM="Pelagodinium beii, Strain RCC1491" /NCGR_SAMPLE_ID=MMETSP1338 /ASSEMBLY_ACC=CAM_ASM_000754 /LENGTH=477 /DNA_ID=CAMNT_0043243499 /DNA_START=25 /DNA_END=1454 /DNA_ORIENTATION=-